LSERPDASDELPAIAGVYVETSRYRRLLSLEQQARAVIEALIQTDRAEDISEALKLAIQDSQEETASDVWALDNRRGELYEALFALLTTIGWKSSSS